MLRPIRGQPGKFMDTMTGRIYNITELREDDKWDTVLIPAGAIPAGLNFVFFRDLAGKQVIDTNFNLQSRLSGGEEMILDRIMLYIPSAVGNQLRTPADIKRVGDAGFFRVDINQLLLAEGPVLKFPAAYGLAGNSFGPDLGVVSNGVPSTAATAKLMKTQLLTYEHEIRGNLTFHNRAWFAAPFPVADQMPSLDGATLVRAFLHGLIKQATSK